MSRILWRAFCFVSRAILSLRYRIEVRGLDRTALSRLKPGRGTLFLPNHPALVDPLMIALFLWPYFQMRPIVVDYIYRTPVLRYFLRVMNAVVIPNFSTSVNGFKVNNAKRAVSQVLDGLKQGDSFLLYPSGRLKSSGKEVVGGSSATHDVLEKDPDVNIVLIRTTGLWGSRFSRALTGRSPDLFSTMFFCIKKTFKSFVFFLPRRRVLIEMEFQPPNFPRRGDRVAINRYLEEWFNRYSDEKGTVKEEEPLQLISYSCWRQDLPEVVPSKDKEKSGEEITISPKTKERIFASIQKIVEKPGLEIRPEMSLAADLGLDSLQIAELVSFISQNYHIADLHPGDLETVGDALEAAEGTLTNEDRLEVPLKK